MGSGCGGTVTSGSLRYIRRWPWSPKHRLRLHLFPSISNADSSKSVFNFRSLVGSAAGTQTLTAITSCFPFRRILTLKVLRVCGQNHWKVFEMVKQLKPKCRSKITLILVMLSLSNWFQHRYSKLWHCFILNPL